ncbi:MAG TPA: AEC family transporter [Candidatus Saccharibacteria bacterium]|jgi:predicted permease|nr:AEC family transporter [Candidatus Saccharibacteria bacterium]
MLDTIIKIFPLILVFGIGYGLKKLKFLTSDDGSSLLKVIFSAGVPALVFTSILKVNIDASIAILCLLPAAIVGTTLLAVFTLRGSLLKKVNIKAFGSLLVGVTIMNTGFLLPFVEKVYGADGLVRFALIDAFNGLLVFSIVYAIAVKLGNEKQDNSFIVKKLFMSPPLWALIIAFSVKLMGLTPPALVNDTLTMIARLVGPVILIALGLKFTPVVKKPGLLGLSLVLRFVLGGLIGVMFVKVFGLHGLNTSIAIFASIAPIGFNSITFAELEKLDVEFAASQVSIAILVALIIAPIVIQILG